MNAPFKHIRSLPGALSLLVAFSLTVIQFAGPLHHHTAHDFSVSGDATPSSQASWTDSSRKQSDTEELCLICSNISQARSTDARKDSLLIPASSLESRSAALFQYHSSVLIRSASPRAPPVSV